MAVTALTRHNGRGFSKELSGSTLGWSCTIIEIARSRTSAPTARSTACHSTFRKRPAARCKVAWHRMANGWTLAAHTVQLQPCKDSDWACVLEQAA